MMDLRADDLTVSSAQAGCSYRVTFFQSGLKTRIIKSNLWNRFPSTPLLLSRREIA